MSAPDKHVDGKPTQYHVPTSSPWPIMGAIVIYMCALGAGNVVQSHDVTHIVAGKGTFNFLLPIGFFGVFLLMVFWFRDVIHESLTNMNSAQMDRSYRQGMAWFIFSEVMFFGAFFGAMFYARWLVVPWLAGEGDKGVMTHEVLWPNFQDMWPLLKTPGGKTVQAMDPWGLPFVNTILLLTSSVTLTVAHHALLEGKRARQIGFLALTFTLGILFLGCQATEYHHAYTEMGLTLQSGIYGSTFFMLTGFHGLHVTIGAIMLTVIWLRTMRGHFTPQRHFAFEAVAWYWHFVDVVWLGLFVFVYWI